MSGFNRTPQIKAERRKLKLELLALQMKEKIFGKLSESEQKRLNEIRFQLSIHY